MEKNENMVNTNEVSGEMVETPVAKENWWTKTKKFGKKHKKGLIAGVIAVVGTVLICATRKSDEEPETVVEEETTTTVETEVETTEE